MTPTDVVFVAGIASALIVALILAAWLRRRAPAPPPLRVQVFVDGVLVIDCDAVALAKLVTFKGGRPDMHRFRGDVVVGFRVDP